eukprot:411978-Pleurochrysis_carterae.AAC.1
MSYIPIIYLGTPGPFQARARRRRGGAAAEDAVTQPGVVGPQAVSERKLRHTYLLWVHDNTLNRSS